MSVAALVVSHNRRELLQKCLDGLIAQGDILDEIIVVDNSSTDGTPAMVREFYPHVRLIESGDNLGGAGGFALGVDAAIELGHESLWLMDDDAEPLPGSLAPLVQAMEREPGKRPGFVASTVLARDGKLLATHVPFDIGDSPNHGHMLSEDLYACGWATFVGVLIDLGAASRTYLPVSDFFIWWDDTEYTARLQRLAGGLASRRSRVMHPDKPELLDIGSRMVPDTRNRLWIIRDERLASEWGRRKARRTWFRRIAAQTYRAANKLQFLKYLLTGISEGLFNRPTLQLPGESLAQHRSRAAARRNAGGES